MARPLKEESLGVPERPSLDDVYEILSERFKTGEHEAAECHNERQP